MITSRTLFENFSKSFDFLFFWNGVWIVYVAKEIEIITNVEFNF